jgi:very-short-patch-repair endonuclease
VTLGGTSMDNETLRIGRDRLSRVFRYLEALNQHRNPAKRQIREQLWTLWLKELPDHPSIKRGNPRLSEQSLATSALNVPSPGHQDSEFVLKVARPKLTRSPEPPTAIATWLDAGWDNPFKEASVRESKNDTARSGETVRSRFSDDAGRVTALNQWKTRRNEWVQSEQPARRAMKVFESLYELYGRIEREAERVELVLGDGILSWRRPEGGVYHPVLLQRLQLTFSPSIPEFALAETEQPVELYSALFQSMPDVDGRAIGRCRGKLEQGGYGPLGDDSTSGFLKRLIVQLSPRGDFVESGAPEGEQDDPRVGREPVIFLRARNLGFAAAIEAILEDLRNRENFPWSLLNIVGLETATPEAESAETSHSQAEREIDVLLSKHANPEQIRIARQMEQAGGVLVQGPPGTGKTHTIGNLIGHLLAQGKSVLVTSHTTKALRMVRSQVESRLRSLCVSVLESDLDSRRQLESAVSTIADRLSKADAKSLQTESESLTEQRQDLLAKLVDLRQRLSDARADEYRDLVVGGKAWSPSESARKIAEERGKNSWIPGPVRAGVAMPLPESEIAELYATNISVSPAVEHELSGLLPETTQLPSPPDFEHLVLERAGLSKVNHEFRADLWQVGTHSPSPEWLSEIITKLIQAVEPLSGKERWKLAAVYAGKNTGPHREPWDKLVSFIEQVHLEVATSAETMLRHSTTLSNDIPYEEQEQIATQIHAHLHEKGELGFLSLLTHKQWRQFIQVTRVNGTQPKLPEHFLAVSKSCRVKVLRRDLATRWDRQMVPLGAVRSHDMGDDIEKSAVQFCGPIRDCLTWNSRVWAPLENELKQLGFLWDKFLIGQAAVVGADGELVRLRKAVQDSLLPIVAARRDHLRWADIETQRTNLHENLMLARRFFAGSRAIASLYEAVDSLDPEAYRQSFARLLELQTLRSELRRRNNLLAKLEAAAPGWAAAIRTRTGLHAAATTPGIAPEAWIWRQLHDELERRAAISIDELQTSIEKLTERLRNATVHLIDSRAWMFQARRTSLAQRQALVGWLDTIRKIGKGTGIRAPRLRAEAARKMTECRGAVPVWVMPLSRVVENFDPRHSRFDVVIIDEASQSDVMALVALYLGRAVVVVGDHEQVSPSAVGQEVAIVQQLIDQFLDGIPNAHLYDGQTSVYDLARQSFGGTIRLVEHFRCVTEIIQFSNRLSYDGEIKPLRDASRVRLKPHVLSFRVDGSSRDGKVNHQEAMSVTSLVAAALEQPDYQTNELGHPTSFGIVSLVGEDQALEIDRLLRTYLSPDVYERHRVLCGTPAQFQGDERDVVFISMVDIPAGGPLPFRDQQMFKQRFNVAASRARDQMWVVHSLNPQIDLQPGDLRRRLIEHAQDPGLLIRILEDKEQRVQSVFERDVMRHLVRAGYRVIPQWKVGSRRIDLVVEGDGHRLAIECDGDRFHPIEKLAEDMERQAILERLGWIFARVRGSVFFREPERAMRPIFDKLRFLEIPPVGATSDSTQQQAPSTGLIDRLIRRADELRNKWSSAAN